MDYNSDAHTKQPRALPNKQRRNKAEKLRVQKPTSTLAEIMQELEEQNVVPVRQQMCKQSILDTALLQLKTLRAENLALLQRMANVDRYAHHYAAQMVAIEKSAALLSQQK